jgi:hypothetical protein
MSPNDVINWLLQSNIHFILSYMHQGIDLVSNSEFWNVKSLSYEIQKLKYHNGFPNGAELRCPIFLQDKFRYFAAVPHFVLPTLLIPLQPICSDDLSFKLRR